MTNPQTTSFTSFDGHCRIATGSLVENALAVKHALEHGSENAVLTFDDGTGRCVDIDIRGSADDIVLRFAAEDKDNVATDTADAAGPKVRGRPKLGVVPREVTLLPRHWEWLASQPGGASVALRKLVDDARRAGSAKDELRKAQERAYHFMQTIAGNLPGFEEATRALFANEPFKFHELLAAWPGDVRDHAMRLAFGESWLRPS
jgi:hypothetical protein